VNIGAGRQLRTWTTIADHFVDIHNLPDTSGHNKRIPLRRKMVSYSDLLFQSVNPLNPLKTA
jgi:hypothetical protein